jgi:hypothetical protein
LQKSSKNVCLGLFDGETFAWEEGLVAEKYLPKLGQRADAAGIAASLPAITMIIYTAY